MQQNRGAPCTRQSFKKRSTNKNPKKKSEDDEKSEAGSCCEDEQNLTDIKKLFPWNLKP